MSQTLAAIVKLLSAYILPVAPAADKAKLIYDWITKNIEYDHKRKKSIDAGLDDGIPHEPEEVIEKKKGICSDMALLYVMMARKMRLKADYASVEVDCEGRNVVHACARVWLQARSVLVDPAYNKFDAQHIKWSVVRPKMKLRDGTIVTVPQRKIPIVRYAAAGIALLYGVCSYFSSATGYSPPKNTGITLLELDSGAKFVSQNGVFMFANDTETGKTMREYVFFCEAKEGALCDGKLLDKYLLADKNKDGIISLAEAVEARNAARDQYFEKKR